MKPTGSARAPGWTSPSRQPTCRGTFAKCTCVTRTDTCFALAKDLRNRPKNKADMRVSCQRKIVVSNCDERGVYRAQLAASPSIDRIGLKQLLF